MYFELEKTALSIRSLSIDAIEQANSGHPGMPLGAAELAAVLYGKILKHSPSNPNWYDRDRFILSAGHGSMLLYSILHISGYPLSLDDIKAFRQVGSKCPGHPELGYTPGVEMTTGPLGQGVSAAVGMAIAETMDAASFNTSDFTIVDHYTYALVGEGCLMEGVTSEASSFAGHLELGKLIVFYDENRVCIDGSTDMTFTEDIAKRYESYNWQVLSGDMYNMKEIEELVEKAKKDKRPSLIMLKSIIGKGADSVAGTSDAHGAPLGKEKAIEAKKSLGLNPDEYFFVANEAYDWFENRKKELDKEEANWNELFSQWAEKYPDKKSQWDKNNSNGGLSLELIDSIEPKKYSLEDVLATRAASGDALNRFASVFPNIVGGSADLTGPNAVMLKDGGVYSADNPNGKYIYYGIREFAMAAITNGIQLHGGYRAFCATFLVFADYLRPALRLAALMKTPSVFVFTHDSIYVGEDGPTHQPVEVLASLRVIPNLHIYRPSDAEEVFYAWKLALKRTDGPSCLVFTRQALPVNKKDDPDWRHTIECGAYIVQKGGENPDLTILATGSEVSLAIKASAMVPEKCVRVVSVVSKELFESQPELLQNTIIGGKKGEHRIITAEAGVSCGWKAWVKNPKDCFAIDRFGESGPGEKVAEHLGFTAEKLADLIKL